MKRMLLALDIETRSTTKDNEDALNPRKSKITCIGVYGEGFKQVYRAPWNDFLEEIYNNNNYSFVGHNFKFDLKHLFHNFGIMPNWEERWQDDTRLMAYVSTDKVSDEFLEDYEKKRVQLNARLKVKHREAGLHSLKTLAPYFLEVEPFWENPENHDNDEYVLKDCEFTYNLHTLFSAKLTELGQYKFYKERLMAWTKMILRAEITGIHLDVEEINKLIKNNTLDIYDLESQIKTEWSEYFDKYRKKYLKGLHQEYEEMLDRAIQKAPHNEEKLIKRYTAMCEIAKIKTISSGAADLNLESPAQLKWLLKDQMGLDITNYSGEESTDKETLTRLAFSNKTVDKLLKLRKIKKITSGFLPTYLELKDENDKIYTEFNITGTRTGRLSSGGPGSFNLQQVPKEIKHIFRSKPPLLFATYDLSAIEPFLMAYFTGDAALIDVVKNNRNFHSLNAIAMFNLDCEEEEVKEKYKNYRDAAKQVGLAILYGAGYNQVKITCLKHGIVKSDFECREIVKNLRDKYADVWNFKTLLDEELEKGEILYNLKGRPLQIKNKKDVYMQGFNTLIQGSASDLCLEIAHDISQLNAYVTPVMFVHDSVVTEINTEKLKESGMDIDNIIMSIEKCFSKTFKLDDGSTITTTFEGGVSNVWE